MYFLDDTNSKFILQNERQKNVLPWEEKDTS